MRASRLSVAILASSVGAAACGGGAPVAQPPRAPDTTSRPRIVAPTDEHSVLLPLDRLVELARAGATTSSVGDVLLGRERWQVGRDGTLHRAVQIFPSAQPVRGTPLPPHLGGGWAFTQQIDGEVALWRAESFLAPLTPVSRFASSVETLLIGFDGLYALDPSTQQAFGVDVTTGELLRGDRLPPDGSLSSLAVASPWLGVARVPLRGNLLSFDGGQSWHATPTELGAARVADGRLLFESSEGRRVLGADGSLTVDDPASDRGGATPGSVARLESPLGDHPLRVAVLRGVADRPGEAIVAARGAIARVSLSDGALLALSRDALPPGLSCRGLKLGAGVGLACGEERGATRIYQVASTLAAREVLSFGEPRYVAASGRGALAVRGPCRGSLDGGLDVWCLRSSRGALRELRVRGDAGVERIVALDDGRAALLVPPRLGAEGRLVIVDTNGSARAVKLKLPPGEPGERAARAFWVDGMVQSGEGRLAGWLVERGSLSGVRVALDGSVEVGTTTGSVEHALLAPERALVGGAQAYVAETTDGGFSWRAAELGDAKRALDGSRGGERACTAIGCSFGGVLRLGWGAAPETGDQIEAELPPVLSSPRELDMRWRLACSPTGALIETPARGADGALDFRGIPAPKPAAGEKLLMQSTGPFSVHATVAYAWFKPGGTVQSLVRAADPFDLRRAVWSSAPAASPWQDPAAVSQVFGDDPRRAPSNWTALFDPGGRAAALQTTARGVLELWLVAESRTPVWVPQGGGLGVERFTSAVLAQSGWWLAGRDSDGFSIARVDGDRLVPVTRLPIDGRELTVSLVRSRDGEALAALLQSSAGRSSARSWYLYPLRRDGGVDAPLVFDARALGRAPPPCDADDDGFVVVATPPADPYVDLRDGADALRARWINARWLLGDAGVCVLGLTGIADAALPKTVGTRGGSITSGIPLVLYGRDQTTQRASFVCDSSGPT